MSDAYMYGHLANGVKKSLLHYTVVYRGDKLITYRQINKARRLVKQLNGKM